MKENMIVQVISVKIPVTNNLKKWKIFGTPGISLFI